MFYVGITLERLFTSGNYRLSSWEVLIVLNINGYWLIIQYSNNCIYINIQWYLFWEFLYLSFLYFQEPMWFYL